MEEILPLLEQSPLFAGIRPAQLPGLLRCLQGKEQRFLKSQMIVHPGAPAGWIGIVCDGLVQVSKEDFMGNRSILAQLGRGELFGEAFACAGTEQIPVGVMAVEDSRILFLHYRRVIATCPHTCSHHAGLIGNMLGILAGKNVMLSGKIEILSRRSTREKLIAYLSAQAQRAGSRRFCIPFNRQEMADYLCVERSAMSAELSKLRRDGLVEYDKNCFYLKANTSG